MEENMERAFERLSELIHNTTLYIQPTYDAAVLELNQYVSSLDWKKLKPVKEEWMAYGEQGIQLAFAAVEGIQKELPHVPENITYWVQEILRKGEQLPWNSKAMWTAFLLILVLMWISSYPKQKKKNRHTVKKNSIIKVEDHMILSLCDLAKASYIKANAREVMDIVDAHHVDPNYSVSPDKMTLFLCACLGGNTGLVNYLLKRGGDVNSRNTHGDTCLHLAVYATSGSRHPVKRLVEILLKHGADANGQNNKGDTPLHIAAMTNDKDMIQLLLLYGANPSITTFDGILPIHIAANSGFMSAAKLLMVKLESCKGWREGDTPPKVTIGLLSPEKAHLVMSSRPKRMTCT